MSPSTEYAPPSTTPAQVYRALSHHAEIIGRNNWVRGLGVSGKGKKRRYTPTQAHRDVCEMMLSVMDGSTSVNDAMSLVWRSDVWEQRFWKPAQIHSSEDTK